MPTDLPSWLWWGFSVVLLSLFLGVGANFIHEALRDRVENWREERRKRARERETKVKEKFERDVQKLFLHQSYVAERLYFRNSSYQAAIGYMIAGLVLIVGASIYYGLLIEGVFPIGSLLITIPLLAVGFYFALRSRQYNKRGKWATDIFNEYICRLELEAELKEEGVRVDYEHDLYIEGLVQASREILEEE